MKRVFLTGATGVMGIKGLESLLASENNYSITILARPRKQNRKKLRPYELKGVRVIWGDLCDYEKVEEGVRNSDIVLHVGGLVSPAADWYPQKTIETNVGAMKNIIKAARTVENPPVIVYIGSVAQYGNRAVPYHWGQTGDVLLPALYDSYAYSKVEGERLLAESNLPRWVSLRQTGILHKGLLMKASDPISFHVPLRGVLEWVTDEDSGRLLERVCRDDIPDSFWNHFYNIGGGESYRMTNYEFETKIMKAIGCPKPEKVFNTNWFATMNFHGFWYSDSDYLENILHYRSGDTVDEYISKMKKELPWYFRLAPLAPPILLKQFMKRVAHTPGLGPMWWIRNNKKGRVEAAFGSYEEWTRIPDWETIDLSRPTDIVPEIREPIYSRSVLEKLVSERGGLIAGIEGDEINPDTRVDLICDSGHRFTLKARTLIEGGHWCSECLKVRAENEGF